MLLLTDLSRDTLLSGATDASAICDLAEQFPQIEIRFLPSIHAKVYVADDKLAIVTSANMTAGGLSRNLEYGVKVDEEDLVRKIKRDVSDYAGLGTRIETSKLKFLSEISSELKSIRAMAEKSIKSRLRSEFGRRLRSFDEGRFQVSSATRWS
jgi:phosphatidylserine/phosphatidylglycerophosphate/cardiolipin synthase-like enzyme